MPWWGIVIVFASTLLVFAVIHAAERKQRPFSRALLSMCVGLLTLTAVNLTSGLTNVSIPVSLLSVMTSAIGGVPGVTLLLFLNLILF